MAALFRKFDNFDVVLFFQCLGQTVADIATPGDDNPLVGIFKPTQLTHDLADIFFGGDKKYLVALLYDGIALGKDRPVPAENRRDPGIHFGHVLAEESQFVPHQWPSLECTDSHQLDQTLGKIDNLKTAGLLDQTEYVVGDHLFRGDQKIHRAVGITE